VASALRFQLYKAANAILTASEYMIARPDAREPARGNSNQQMTPPKVVNAASEDKPYAISQSRRRTAAPRRNRQ